MKYLLIISLLLFTGCSNTMRINRQLMLSKKHLMKAQLLGAHMDSIKTTVKQTGNVESLKDSAITTAKIDTTSAIDACAELLSAMANITSNQKKVIDSLKGNQITPTGNIITGTHKPIQRIQKAVCPDDRIHKVGTIDITIGNQEIKIPFTIDAWAVGGKAGYIFQLSKRHFEYTAQTIQVNATPGKLPTWWEKLISSLSLFLLGALAGAISMLILGIVKKIVKLGI